MQATQEGSLKLNPQCMQQLYGIINSNYQYLISEADSWLAYQLCTEGATHINNTLGGGGQGKGGGGECAAT